MRDIFRQEYHNQEVRIKRLMISPAEILNMSWLEVRVLNHGKINQTNTERNNCGSKCLKNRFGRNWRKIPDPAASGYFPDPDFN